MSLKRLVTRPVRAPIDSFANWDAAARFMGTTRDAWMTAVLDTVAEYLKEKSDENDRANRRVAIKSAVPRVRNKQSRSST